MVGPRQVTNAVGFNSAVFPSSRMLGPAIAGLVITLVGTGWCFLYNGLSFFAYWHLGVLDLGEFTHPLGQRDVEGVGVAEGLEPHTLASLREGLGKSSMIGNPLDLQNTRTSWPGVFRQGIRSVCADANVDVLAVRFNLTEHPTSALDSLYRVVADIARAAGKTLIVLTRAYEHLDLVWWRFFADLGIPFVLSYRNALRGLTSFSNWLAGRAQPTDDPGAIPAIAGAEEGTSSALDPDETRDWLEAAGVSYVRSETVDDPEGATRVAEDMGWPVVLKAVAPGLVHKSEAGGVALGLSDVAAVEAAAKAMAVSVSDAIGVTPESVRFEVQQMVSEGVEVIVGMVPDPTWGPVVMIGAGGIHAETTGDVVWDLPPISPSRANELLRRLRIWPVLDGARNQPRADIDALVELVVAFSRAIAEAGTSLAAVDLNPVLVAQAGSGVRAVDAAILRAGSRIDGEE